VLPFAKRGDDRSNNLVRLQQLFPRIVAADYEQPRRVTDECRHLLKRMLTPDPTKRITIPEIMQHSWCVPTSSSFGILFLHCSANVTQEIAMQMSTHECIRPKAGTSNYGFQGARISKVLVLGLLFQCLQKGEMLGCVWCRFLSNLGPGMGELNNRLVQKGVPPQLQKVEEIEAIVQQATQTGGRPAWAMDDWLS
jgi:hypothetical protein